MCMHIDPIKVAKTTTTTSINQLETILVSVSTILAGSIFGISCAAIVPAYFIIEGILALSAHLILAAMFLLRRKKDTKNRALPDKASILARISSDTDSAGTAGTDESCRSAVAVEPQPLALPSNPCPSLLETLSPLNDIPLDKRPRSPRASGKSVPAHVRVERNEVLRLSLTKKAPIVPPPAAADPSLPINERVVQERLRLSFTDNEPESVRATATSLRFVDTDGRTVRYVLRPSKKATRATFLEVNVDGAPRPRKVNRILYDGSTNVLSDKKESIPVPLDDIEQVMKSLKLLCKIAGVKLEATNALPSLRPVLSNLDMHGTTMKRVHSGGALSQVSASTIDDSFTTSACGGGGAMKRVYSGGALSQM